MKYLLYSFLLIVSCNTFAQQEQQYSQYMINQFTLNPAIAGTEDFIDINLGFRNQWTGFESAPRTYYLSAHGTLGKSTHQYHHQNERSTWHGVGTQIYRDETGPIVRNAYLLAYAYNFPLSKNIRVSVGSYVGMKQQNYRANFWQNIDDTNDGLFANNINTGLQPDLHLGGLIYAPTFFINLAVNQLLNKNLIYSGLTENATTNGKFNKHVFASAGLKLAASETVELMPSMMFKYTPSAPLSIDFNLKVKHNNKYWYGASYRWLEAVNAFVGAEVHQQIDVSYAFEWSTTTIGGYIKGTHEIIVGLRLAHPKSLECPSKYW